MVPGVSSEGVGVVWLLVPTSCSIRSVPAARSISSYRIETGQYAPFLLARFPLSSSLVIRWRQGVSFSLSSRPSSRLPVS